MYENGAMPWICLSLSPKGGYVVNLVLSVVMLRSQAFGRPLHHWGLPSEGIKGVLMESLSYFQGKVVIKRAHLAPPLLWLPLWQ